jgi:uncharacterized protein YceK
MHRLLPLMIASTLLLGGCAPMYSLVKPAPVKVAQGAMQVTPTIAWNKQPHGPFDIPSEENWTQNGPMLDSIGFIGALADGQAIAKQRPKDDRKVPVFRATMTPQDLVSMIESYYRIKVGATVFETVSVKPANFLGTTGIQFNYNYVGADEVKRRGRSLVAIVDKKLYLMSLDGAVLHYFDAALPAFEALAASATIS